MRTSVVWAAWSPIFSSGTPKDSPSAPAGTRKAVIPAGARAMIT